MLTNFANAWCMVLRAIHADWLEAKPRTIDPNYNETFDAFFERIAWMGVQSTEHGGCLCPQMLPWGGAFGNHWGI